MRKITSVAISMSVALVLAVVSADIRKSVVAVKANELSFRGGEAHSVSPTPQSPPFVWVLPTEEGDFPGYKRVEGGALNNGTKLDICRAQTIPGKVYKNLCLYPYAGAEGTYRYGYYQVLLTNTRYEWKWIDDVSRTEIKNSAIKGGTDRDGADTLYICRKKFNDGVHPGKYSYKNRLCYVSWGGKEFPFKGSFEVLFR